MSIQNRTRTWFSLTAFGFLALSFQASVPSPGLASSEGESAFEDISSLLNLGFTHQKAQFDPALVRIMNWMASLNAGVAATDYDGDGDTDLYFLSSRRGTLNKLFRNEGNLQFVDVTEESGLGSLNNGSGVSMDVVFSDTDNDGDQDLFVAAYGSSKLLINDRGRFRLVGPEAGLSTPGNAAAVVVLDYDLDGLLDILVGNYFDDINLWRIPHTKILQTNFHSARNGGPNRLYRNQGNNTFKDVGKELGLDDRGWTLAIGAGDLDGDLDPDVYLANDYGYDVIYRNEAGKGFTKLGPEAIVTDSSAGMSVDFGDADGDGDLDIYVTNITNQMMPQGNMLWSNEGELVFTETGRRRQAAHGGWGWGGKFLDYDNDGDLDIFTVNGFVSDGPVDIFRMGRPLNQGTVDDIRIWPDMRGLSLSGYESSRLFRNDGPTFKEVAKQEGVDSKLDGRGVALADLDLDGDQDIVVSNCAAPPIVYRNKHGNQAAWLQVDLIASEGNRDAIGARVLVTNGDKQILREVDGGNGFSAQSSRTLHFGLSSATATVQVDIHWQSGKKQRFHDVPVRSKLRVRE